MGRRFPLLLGLFVASGCSALIYEIVWFQLLELIIGSTAVSLGVLLAAFMGGMCAGSLSAARFFPQRTHPLRNYAVIELGIALCGVGVLWAMPLVERSYAAASGWGLSGIGLRAVVALVCLLPPAILMGAALPVIARWVEAEADGVFRLGYLYGGNTGGAIIGCLLAGFYLLRVQDAATATYAAASLNIAVAAVSLVCAARTDFTIPKPERERVPVLDRWVLLIIALSGCCALGAEVVWTRVLSLILGGTVYTFSLILAGVLLGLGMGAGIGSWLGRRLSQPWIALGWCQMMAAVALAATGWLLATTLPFWLSAASHTPWVRFAKDLLRSLAATLPATLFWGASFPLALRASSGEGGSSEQLVGGTYAANTAGAVIGALGFSLIAIPALGTHGSQRLLIALALSSGLLAWVRSFRQMRVSIAASVAAGLVLIWTLPALPWGIITHGRQFAATKDLGRLIHLEEGMNSSIAVSELDGTRTFHVSGKVEASSGAEDMRMQRMLGHLAAVLHDNPKRVLVVGCGAGVTAGSFVVHPEVERLVVCEIEVRTARIASRYFHHENHGVFRDPRTVVVNDDARHFILTAGEQFDIITSDPIHPWVKGSATLYTREYFELCKRRLRPGGMVVQWVPLYESTPEVVQSELATFFEAFPGGTVWGNDTLFGEGYDVVLLGRVDAGVIDVDRLQKRFEKKDFVLARKSMREVGLGSAVNLLGTYAGRASELRTWLAGAQINQDRNLRLQYLAGLGLNRQDASAIYDQMLRRRKYPQDLMRATGATEVALRKAMGIRD